MQLLAIVLYSSEGEQRVIRLNPGALNVITGVSATGKSSLLDIVDFCLGRSTVTMAVGPITNQVAWYGVLLQVGSGQAFVARPRPVARASTQVAMLELGANLTPLPFDRLEINTDVNSVRAELGRRIGIEENESVLGRRPGVEGLEANLGHAVLLCIQGQAELANRDLLFHRQGEPRIADAIRATLPYFLGAAPRNQGMLRQRLLEARRRHRRAEEELRRARALDEESEFSLRGLGTEAVALGLISPEADQGREALVRELEQLITSEEQEGNADDEVAVRRSHLLNQRERLREDLRSIGEQIALLERIVSDGSEYGAAVASAVSRLRSIELLGSSDGDANACPVCGTTLHGPDPTAEELLQDADTLQEQLQALDAATPVRRSTLDRLQGEAERIRQELRSLDAAIDGLAAARDAIGDERRGSEQIAFFRGRVQQYLSQGRAAESTSLQELEARVQTQALAVESLEAQLDTEGEREQVDSRLAVIGADMTAWSDRLQLEHQTNVRLDLRRLTVVTDTPSGPAPLFRIGSAENWVGYHLVSHLALHRFFVLENRPVPHFLMLDQPTTAYYPSDVEQEAGVPAADQDRVAVQRLYELLRDVADELAPAMQIVVCDHANLPEDWFRTAVAENWRGGEKLVPAHWPTLEG